jgi:hypothetical protein
MEGLKLEHTSGQWKLSLIHLTSVCRLCYAAIEITFSLSLWLMLTIWEKTERNFRSCCKKKSHMKSNGRIYMLTWSLQLTVLQNGYTKLFFNPLNAELNPICHLLILLGDLTFMGTCIVSISNKMQRTTVYLYLNVYMHTIDKGWSSCWWLGDFLRNPHRTQLRCYKIHKALDNANS